MFPIIYQFNKFLSINGYGVMLGIGFYLAYILLEREFKLRNISQDLAYKILLVGIPCGIIGSKIFDILEHLDEFIVNPMGMLFSGSGLSAYGGFILSFIVAVIVIKKTKNNVLDVFDASSPSMALGYCFGRFGCHVAGDGCFGIQTSGFFATAYPNGIVPSTMTVYPTPLFEVIVSFIAFGILLNARKHNLQRGRIFSLFLIMSGLPRLLVEFIRLNPKSILGFSQAQIIGIIFICCGLSGWIYFGRKHKLSVV
jgi:phosphatidylglycerol---prolipoprotein diacylglyceryl transferase